MNADGSPVRVREADAEVIDSDRLAWVADQLEIRDVYHRYCRGIDRRQFELVRSCYHADATDNHGEYVGTVDGLIDYLRVRLARFERTMHSTSNILIELDGDRARGEAYVLVHHLMPAWRNLPRRDFVAAGRYVDDFERRNGVWRIARRVCVFEWTRLEPVADSPYRLTETHLMGRADGDDPVFASSLLDL